MAGTKRNGDRALLWGAGLLGFALGGFFDGILLHQILQWHHLLSLVEGVDSLAVQVTVDGFFHLLMYLVAGAGLWLLWRGRRGAAAGGRFIPGWALIGFGLWHVIDAVASHWVLGIHRIRVDSPNPLFWDLLWFLVFGVAVVGLGLWYLRRAPGGGGGGGLRVGAGLGMAALVAGPIAALPPSGQDGAHALVVFRPGVDFAGMIAAVDAVDGRLVWTDASSRLWAIEIGAGASASALYRHGALLVSNGPIAAGCLSWSIA